MNSIHQKSVALVQVDEFGLGQVQRKPTIAQQSAQNGAIAQSGSAEGLLDDNEMKALQRKQIWSTILISGITIALFVMALKFRWVKI